MVRTFCFAKCGLYPSHRIYLSDSPVRTFCFAKCGLYPSHRIYLSDSPVRTFCFAKCGLYPSHRIYLSDSQLKSANRQNPFAHYFYDDWPFSLSLFSTLSPFKTFSASRNNFLTLCLFTTSVEDSPFLAT